MSITELAKGAVDALKNSPLLLALVLLNVVFAGAGLLYLKSEQHQVDLILSRCLPGTLNAPSP